MKQILLMITVVVGQSVLATDVVITDFFVEKAIRSNPGVKKVELTDPVFWEMTALVLKMTVLVNVADQQS